MTTPLVYGGLGIPSHGLGRLGLGGPQPPTSFALPAMATTTQPYIAHLFDHTMSFKRTLGAASLVSKPALKQTQNGGYQPITLELAASVAGIVLGDVVRLSEQGDSAGTILFTGNVESTPEEQGLAGTHHQLTVTPWIAELGDAFFNKTYAAATDVAQFVRDAVAGTAHCSVSPVSCPDSGVKAMYDFQNTNALDAVHVAKQIAGANFFYFVDAQGVVWFQPVYTANPATLTLRRGIDYNYRKSVSTIVGQKNLIPVIGGSNPGDPGRIKSTYGTGDPLGHQALYGVRAFNPTLSYPTVTDQATLDAIAASLGAQFDRVLNTVALETPALGKRLTPGRAGGLTVRFWEPAKPSITADPAGTGTYSATYVLQDVEARGPKQILLVGDIPYTDTDTTYEAMRIAQRIGVVSATAVPIAPLVPPAPATIPAPPPSKVNVSYAGNASTGIYAIGGGVAVVATVTFTTTRAGVVQLLSAIDARMESWDNFVAAPRRTVWADLSTIVTNATQELPFGITRVQLASNSASGIAIPAGTYTATLNLETHGYNQMHVYSGWVQADWTG